MTLTPEEEMLSASRHIDVDKVGTKTMTRHRMGYMGTLRFKNWSNLPLVITASEGNPFLVQGCSDPVSSFTVTGGQEMSVKIHSSYGGDAFTYSARIDGTEAEDPIVIIDRR